MPSRKPRIWLTVSEEERVDLFLLWKELRQPWRRRQPEYIGQKLTFNAWLSRLTQERAAHLRADLGASSGTVQRPMKTKSPETTESKKRGRRPNPLDAPKAEPVSFRFPPGTKDRIQHAVDRLRVLGGAGPKDMTSFVLEAINEKIEKVPSLIRAPRKTSR